MSIPRPEHPRPQFQRDQWLNLNGTWSVHFDWGKSGIERGLHLSHGFADRIVVPFCPEAKLSGIGHTDFIEALWYHRVIEVPDAWSGKRVLLHFGGCDYMTEVFVDGKYVSRHFGGNVSFDMDITRYVRAGQEHHLVVHVRDDLRSMSQPAGKQCPFFKSRGCLYTRVTGIWSTVWLEAMAPTGLDYCAIIPDLDGSRLILTPIFHAETRGQRLRVTALADGEPVASLETSGHNGIPTAIPIRHPRAWSPEDPFLYDLVLEVLSSSHEVIDRVHSYAGLRKVHVEGDRFLLNNKPIYQRLVLDQGYWPDGLWTAPDDASLKRDIELSMACGFNGARLHQKVFDERFHYWADKLGYLTWAEGTFWSDGPVFLHDQGTAALARNCLAEWREVVERDRNHPSIIMWTPFNEAWHFANDIEHKRVVHDAYALTRSIDATRPVNDASGGIHVVNDIYSVHCYEQDPEKLQQLLRGNPEQPVYRPHGNREPPYEGQPYFVDEFGGIKWIPGNEAPYADNSWGYGEPPRSLKEFYIRLKGQVEAINALPNCAGYCYTQLVDVEQEQNGLYTYERQEKFDLRLLREVFVADPSAVAASAR